MKITGTTFAGAAALGACSNEGYKNKAWKKIKGTKQIPTYCNICFWKCGAIAHIKDGELWKITGNPNDRQALSPRNRRCRGIL